MIQILKDLFRHEAWADNEMLLAVQACPDAWKDRRLHERLNHAHMAQRAYLWTLEGKSIDEGELERPFPSIHAFRQSVAGYHARMDALLERAGAGKLDAPAGFPWDAFRPAVWEAMLQLVLHSHYHRGQAATRLRELGGTPPLTDYIAWAGQGRPSPGA